MKVSVIMPVYNARPFLERSITSVLIQEEVLELICVDDGSTDGSYEFLETWRHKDPRLRLLRHPGGVRKRAAASRNLGLKNAKGDYIAFLDADDEFLKDRFNNISFQILSGMEIDLSLSNVVLKFENGKEFMTSRSSDSPMDVARQIFLNPAEDPIPNISGLVLSRNMMKKLGCFDESLLQKEDKDYMLRAFLVALPSKVFLDNQAAAIYYQYEGSTSTVRKEHYEDASRWYMKWLKKSDFPFSKWIRLKFIWQFMVVKNRADSWKLVRKLLFYPFLYMKCVIKYF
jgi:glycosyltransferase involved in cell wall biosynthesis